MRANKLYKKSRELQEKDINTLILRKNNTAKKETKFSEYNTKQALYFI